MVVFFEIFKHLTPYYNDILFTLCVHLFLYVFYLHCLSMLVCYTIVSGRGAGWYLLKRLNPLHSTHVLSHDQWLLFVNVVPKCISFFI